MTDKQKKHNKALRTIGEAAEMLDLEQHVLRFWEKKFTQIKPVKSRGRRYYRPEDIEIIGTIKHLLYDKGLTIKGAILFLRNQEKVKKSTDSPPVGDTKVDNIIKKLTLAREQLAAIIAD